ncbi:MAG: hypothetical protein HY329_11715 [Chloroflexi bacterium]|nr:hypothetical protein [Chloroflexota bacterium]
MLADLTGSQLPAGVDPFLHADWTVGVLRDLLVAIAHDLQADPTELHCWVAEKVRRDAAQHRALAERAARELERLRAGRLIPTEPDLNKVIRYETHLHRQLVQTMHELEALQARRRGLPAPLARLDLTGFRRE